MLNDCVFPHLVHVRVVFFDAETFSCHDVHFAGFQSQPDNDRLRFPDQLLTPILNVVVLTTFALIPTII